MLHSQQQQCHCLKGTCQLKANQHSSLTRLYMYFTEQVTNGTAQNFLHQCSPYQAVTGKIYRL